MLSWYKIPCKIVDGRVLGFSSFLGQLGIVLLIWCNVKSYVIPVSILDKYEMPASSDSAGI